jgi:hypothetical protein
MTKRALQLSLCKMQYELLRTKKRLICAKADKYVIDIIEARIVSIKKTRYELSSRQNKDSISSLNMSFGKYFWYNSPIELPLKEKFYKEIEL